MPSDQKKEKLLEKFRDAFNGGAVDDEIIENTKKVLKEMGPENSSYVLAQPFPDGNTALHIAAINGNSNLAKLLVENGADLEAKDSKNRTPLEAAKQENRSWGGLALNAFGAGYANTTEVQKYLGDAAVSEAKAKRDEKLVAENAGLEALTEFNEMLAKQEKLAADAKTASTGAVSSVADQVKSSGKKRVTFDDEFGKELVTERAVEIDNTILLRNLSFSELVPLTNSIASDNPTATAALSDAVDLAIGNPTMVPEVKKTLADALEEKGITAVSPTVVDEINGSTDPAIKVLKEAEILSTGDRVLSEEIAVSNAQLNQRLKGAALNNNLEEIQKAVADGANIHSLTAEEIATYNPEVRTAINGIKDKIETFIEFARKGDIDNIDEAIMPREGQGTHNLWLVNAQDKDENTASHAATKAEQEKALSVLLDSGADLTIANNNRELPINLSNSEETDRIIQGAAILQRERTASISSTVTEYDYQPPAKSGARFFDFGMAKRAQDIKEKASDIRIKKHKFIETAQEAAKASIVGDTTKRDEFLTELVKLNEELNQSPSSEAMLVDQKYGQIVDGQLMTTLANDKNLDPYTQKFLRKLAFQNAIENIPHLGVGYVDKYIDQMRTLDTTAGYQPLQDKLPSISASGDVILEDKDPLHLAALTNPSLLIRMSRVYDTVDSPNLSLAEKQAREKAGIPINDKPTESEIAARKEAGRTIAVNQPDKSGRTVLENLVERAKEIEAENAKLNPAQRAAKAVSDKTLGSQDFQLAVMAEMIERETGKLSDEVAQKLRTELERTDEPKLSPNNALRSILEPMVGIVVADEKHAANLLVKKAANYQAEKAHREEIISTRGALVAASIAFPLVYALKKAGYQETTIANVEKFAREAGQATGVYASKLGAGYDAPGAILGNLALGLATIPAVAGVVGGVVVVGAAKGYKLSKDVASAALNGSRSAASWMYNNPKTTAMIATSPIWGSALGVLGLVGAGIATPFALVGGVGYKYAPIRTLIKHTVGPVVVAGVYTAGVAAYQVYRTSADVTNRIFQRIPKYISNSVQLAPKELHLGNAKKTLDNALDRALDGIPAEEIQGFKDRLAAVAELEKKVLTELAKEGEGTNKANLSIGKETFQQIMSKRTQIFADMKLSEERTRDLETLSNKLLKTSVECYEARAHMAQNVLDSTAKDAQNQETRLKHNKMSETFRNAFASVNAPYQWAYNKAFGTPEERAQKSQEKFMADKFNPENIKRTNAVFDTPEGREDLRLKANNLERFAALPGHENGLEFNSNPKFNITSTTVAEKFASEMKHKKGAGEKGDKSHRRDDVLFVGSSQDDMQYNKRKVLAHQAGEVITPTVTPSIPVSTKVKNKTPFKR